MPGSKGVRNKMKVFVIDLSICNGCYSCQIACKDEHVSNDWTPYAKPQPDTGQFWVKILEEVRGTVPKVRVAYRPHLCMHCDEAPCIPACRRNAIYKREDGIVIIDPEKCAGHRNCIDACPYGVIYFNEDLNIAQKCTSCAHLLDNGWSKPRCADVCPTEAIKFGEESEFTDLIVGAEVIRPELGLKPRVYYLNIMKRFVAGTVYDPQQKEVVIGAICTLTDTRSGEKLTVSTDNFGDFWFKGLPDNGGYNLHIEKDGIVKAFEDISTRKDVNLGDIPLT